MVKNTEVMVAEVINSIDHLKKIENNIFFQQFNEGHGGYGKKRHGGGHGGYGKKHGGYGGGGHGG